MGKLQSTDYIFIVGLVVLVAIAGSIIFLIMTAEVVDPDESRIDIITEDNKPNDVQTPPNKKDNNPLPYKFPNEDEIVLNDTIVWASYKDWTPAKKYEFDSKYTINGVVTDFEDKPLKDVEVGITPLSVLEDKVMPVEAKPYAGEKAPTMEEPLDVTKFDLSGIAPAYKTCTDEHGQYSFPYFTGYYVLFVKKQFYYEQKLLCNYDGNTKNFKLDRWGTLIGRVLESSGKPIHDYMITLYKAKTSKIAGDANLVLSGFENENFRVMRYTYHVRNMKFGMHLPEGLFDVVISAEGYNERQIAAYKIEKNSRVEENFTLFGNTMLKGIVTVKGKPDIGIDDVAIAIQEKAQDGYKAILKTTSDEKGEYFFEITRPGKYSLTAVHSLYKSKQIEVSVAESQTRVLNIELDPGTFLLGTVVNEDEEPVEYARVNLTEYPQNQRLGVRFKNVSSNHEGKFVIPELKPGTYQLMVSSKEFYFNYRKLVTIVEGENSFTATLKRGVVVTLNIVSDTPLPTDLHVELVRDIDKSPLPMLKLAEEYDVEWSEADSRYSGRTESKDGDRSGKAVISGVYPGSYFINIRNEELVEVNEPIEIPKDAKTFAHTVNISSGFALSGTVKDDKNNIVPIAYVKVLLGDKYVRSMSVDKDGKFFIKGLGNKTYTLKIEAREYIGIEKEIQMTGSLIDQVFIVDSGESLTGMVLGPDGKPVREGVGIKLYAPPRGDYERYPITRVDKEGKFAFKGLTQGKFKIEVIGAKGIQVDNYEVQVPGNIVINLSNGIRVFGTIKDHNNQPVNRATVLIRRLLNNPAENEEESESLEIDAGEHIGSAMTNEKGEFEIAGLKPELVEITVYNKNNRSTNPVYRKTLTLSSDYELDVVLEQTYEISGSIKYTNGNFPKNFFVKVYRKDENAIGSAGNLDPKTGEFVVSGLTAGTHVLELISHYSPNGVYKQEISVPMSKPLKLVIDEVKVFKVAGSIVDEAGNPIKYARVQFLKENTPSFQRFAAAKSDGTFVITNLLAGDYKVLVITPKRGIINPVFNVSIVDKDISDLKLKANKIMNGVYVKAIRPGSFGHDAGLQSGDIVIEYNGVEIKNGTELDRLSLRAIGTAGQVSIKVVRNGSEKTLMIQPGEIGIVH